MALAIRKQISRVTTKNPKPIRIFRTGFLRRISCTPLGTIRLRGKTIRRFPRATNASALPILMRHANVPKNLKSAWTAFSPKHGQAKWSPASAGLTSITGVSENAPRKIKKRLRRGNIPIRSRSVIERRQVLSGTVNSFFLKNIFSSISETA